MASNTSSPFRMNILGFPTSGGEFSLPEELAFPENSARECINRQLELLPSLEREFVAIKARLDTPAEKTGDRERSRIVRQNLNDLWCIRALVELERAINSAHEVRRAGSAMLG